MDVFGLRDRVVGEDHEYVASFINIALESPEQGNVTETVWVLKAALQDVDRDRLLTTTEAAQLLRVRSINTVKAWCRAGYIKGVVQGGRTLIPMAEIERLQESDRVRGVRRRNDCTPRALHWGATTS